MIAFSVIVMCSGQTFVQQRVMLQKPIPCVSFRSAEPVRGVERVHLERGGVDEEPRADEPLELAVIAQDVAHVLAQEALDALAELLHAVDVALLTCARCRPARRACAA